MAFFQQTVLDKYLRAADHDLIQTAYTAYKATFHNPAVQENIRNSKEEQYQRGFLRNLFVDALGYTLNPTENYNLTTEYKNVKDSKKADGAIIVDKRVKAVIELKGTNTTDLDKIETQAFGYKNNQPGCTYVIISNFEKLRFYIDNAVEHIEFNLFSLSEEEFALLWICLAYENIRTDLPQKIKSASLSEEDKVTKELYKDYSRFKHELFRNMVQKNPQYDELELFKQSQKLLDRFLFIFFAEDRNLLPPNSMRKILHQWEQLKELDAYTPLYNRFKMYFAYMNTGFKGQNDDVFAYNGGLFKPDALLDAIVIDDDVLYNHTLKLSQYNYASEVDVNILGHIFENSLNEIEEVKARIEGKTVDKSKTKRKKDGVYYTPKYITKYIVKNTVGKLCDEKKQELGIVEEDYLTERKRNKATKKPLLDKLEAYREWLLQLTICDPACGSGAFLNQALDFLINEHHYIDELQTKLSGYGLAFEDVEISILENNLFGVDLNEESVEIAKLSLWLRTARPRRKLNDLNNNIKCGNSLIDDPDVAGDKAFNWQQEFPHIFARGGFDVVIGNPPWVSLIGKHGQNIDEESLNFLISKYNGNTYLPNLFEYFISLAINITKENGVSSLIVPDRFGQNEVFLNLRKSIIEKYYLCEVIYKWDFPEIVTDTMTYTIRKLNNDSDYVIKIKNRPDGEFVTYFKNEILSNPSIELKAYENNLVKSLVYKLLKNDPLSCIAKSTSGFGGNSKLITEKRISDTQIEIIKGQSIGKYQSKDKLYFEFIDANITGRTRDVNKLGKKEKVLLRKTGNTIIATYDNFGVFPEQSLYFIYDFQNEVEGKYILSVLNSKLITWLYVSHFVTNLDSTPQLKNIDLNSFPLVKINAKEQECFQIKADQMLSLNCELQELSGKFIRLMNRRFEMDKLSGKLQNWHQLTFNEFLSELKKAKISLSLSQESEWETYFTDERQKAQAIQQQIEQTDREIDQMVYQLYGLTEEEIAIVEG